jgi:serine/threonine protein kinase
MPLSAGTSLGPYEILASIGAGGMGEVYRARDAKLKRDVAIKVLPAALARDPDRLARFEREARLMASLDHPNIGIIYGIEESNHTLALVLALIEGPTLADRIATGPVPIEEAIHIAGQIADALEYAHDRGVIHRDLKPANVKITPEGTVKVLDFGLAKALTGEADALSASPANSPAMSPTLTMRATQAGMILGTAAYMAPEQAKGKTADRRADIWAFGVVFFEMLTGEPLFTGDSAAEIMASAIKEEPNLNRLPKSTPPAIRRLIERCLNKDPKQRLQAIGEARITLRSPHVNVEPAAVPSAELPVAPAAPKKSLLPWIIAASAILALALAALSWVHFREVPPVEKSLRFQIPPPDQAPIGAFRLSPDGRYLAFISGAKVWVRSLDSLESKSLEGTEGATYPFWSPDSENLGFFSGGKLKRIPRTGGPVQTLCDAATGRGGTWSREGVIVFSPGPTATLFRVSAAGGAPVPVTKFLGSSASQGHRFPEFLPDGQHFLYAAQSDKPEDNGVYVGGLDGTRARILPEQSSAIFAPGPAGQTNGYILFRRLDTLMAQPFDAARLQLAGDVFPVSDRVGEAFASNTGFGAFSLSADGTLVLGSGESGSRQFVWFDRAGKRMAAATEPGNLLTDSAPTLSPDGKKLVYVAGNNEESTIWLQDLAGGSPSRFTFAPGRNSNGVWSPDGSRIVFSWQSRSTSNSDLIVKPANGAGKEELLLHAGVNGVATDWSRDGKLLAYSTDLPSADLWLLPLEGERKPVSFLRTPFGEQDGHFSPDAKFLVYNSDESGQHQIYVQPVPPNGSKWQVSKAGGANPAWRRDGKEIFYVAPDRKLMAVPVKTEPAFEATTPQTLFEAGNGAYIPSPDGQRFLVVVPAGGEAAQAPSLTVVTHWQAGLKK